MDDSAVQLGLWTNYSNGTVAGLTLTTDKTRGNLLLSFTGFFIPFVASRFWRIFCIILHRFHSSPESDDAIHQQRQIILRNSSSPDSGFYSLFRLMWAWRQLGRRSYARLFPSILFAALIIIASTVAGGFSALISSSVGSEVLLKGGNCGIMSTLIQQGNESLMESPSIYALPRIYASARSKESANYADQCYTGNGTGSLGCDTYIVKNLPTATSNKNWGCPFGGDLCQSNNSNIRLDTGFIHSNKHLGLNAPEKQSLSWRYVLQCAPLKTQGYTILREHDNKTLVLYRYGDSIQGPANNHTYLSTTYAIEDVVTQYKDKALTTSSGLGYKLSIIASITQDGKTVEGSSAFKPSPELMQAGGDVNLIFLSGNGIVFSQPTNDAWYRATTPGRKTGNSGFDIWINTYLPDEAASPMGCVDQYQWCNNAYPGESGCGPLASLIDSINGAIPFFDLNNDGYNNPTANTTIGSSFIWAASMLTNGFTVSLASIIFQLASFSLASTKSVYGGVQYSLPDDQWQQDVTNWWNMTLASMQAVFVNVAIGPKTENPDFEIYQVKPMNSHEQKLCNSQKIRSTSFTSFNVLGLLITYIAGTFIIIASWALEPLLCWMQRHRQYKEYKYLEWSTHDTLQLHRLVQEELGITDWSGCVDEVPTTTSDKPMAALDIQDPRHPIFARGVVATSKERDPMNSSHSVHETSIQDHASQIWASPTAQSDTVSLLSSEDLIEAPIDGIQTATNAGAMQGERPSGPRTAGDDHY